MGLKLAAVVGPTGVGKSRIAVKVAKMMGAEIISCDSMQVYRGMDIGTAKITSSEMEGVPHHLIDIMDPTQLFSVTEYQKRARALIEDLNQKGRLPILVGGTGLYYQAVVDEYDLQPIPRDEELRKDLNQEAVSMGTDHLHQRLKCLDPEAAARIKSGDQKRIVRALEVIELTGQSFSSFRRRSPGRYLLAAEGLLMPRSELYRHLDERVDEMLKNGLVEEVRGILEKGCNRDLTSMQALGYAHIVRFLENERTWSETVSEIKRDSRRYAKRQLTWFRKDSRINWWNVLEYKSEDELSQKICAHISRTILENVE